MKNETIVTTIIGVIGGAIAKAFGGWTTDMTTLLIFMAVDFLLGLLIAGVFKKSGKSKTGALSSQSAWIGLCRKGVALLIVLVGHRLDITLGVDYIKTAVVIAFIASEGISIVENVGIMGLPLPNVIVKAIDVLKQKGDGKNGESN